MYGCLRMNRIWKKGIIQVILAHFIIETNNSLKTDEISFYFCFVLLQIMYELQPHILSVFTMSLVSVTE